RTQLSKDLVDLNGDGLPDLVERDGTNVTVQLNLGGRFGARETFGQVAPELQVNIDTFENDVEHGAVGLPAGVLDSTRNALRHETTISTDESGGFNFVVVSCSHSSKHTSTRVTRELADVNGDGLPDLLFKRDGEDSIRVQINRGGSF